MTIARDVRILHRVRLAVLTVVALFGCGRDATPRTPDANAERVWCDEYCHACTTEPAETQICIDACLANVDGGAGRGCPAGSTDLAQHTALL